MFIWLCGRSQVQIQHFKSSALSANTALLLPMSLYPGNRLLEMRLLLWCKLLFPHSQKRDTFAWRLRVCPKGGKKKKKKTNVMFHLILFFFVFSNLEFLAGWIVPPVKSNEFLSWRQYSVKEHKKKWTEHIGQRGVIWECFYFMLTLTEGSSLTCLFPLPFPSV